MKIAGKIIQNRNIKDYNSDTFYATYKNKSIYITNDHGFGFAKYKHLNRYMIQVIDIKSGMYDIDTYQDIHDIRDGIIYALNNTFI